MNCQRIHFICHARGFIAVKSFPYSLKNLTDMVIEKITIQYHFFGGAEQFAQCLSGIWIIAEQYLVMKRNILSSCECIHW